MPTHDGVETLIATMTGTLMALPRPRGRRAGQGARHRPDRAAVQTYAIAMAGREKSFYGRAVQLSLPS